MRITQVEVATLIHATKTCFGKTAEIWLFGSRTDDTKHGGDIDLYIETDAQNNLFKRELNFRQQIYDTFGEQKIDILVRSRQVPIDPFQAHAKSTGLLLSL